VRGDQARDHHRRRDRAVKVGRELPRERPRSLCCGVRKRERREPWSRHVETVPSGLSSDTVDTPRYQRGSPHRGV